MSFRSIDYYSNLRLQLTQINLILNFVESLVDFDLEVEHKPVCLMASDKRACVGLVNNLDVV
jgi:hypothetical protein